MGEAKNSNLTENFLVQLEERLLNNTQTVDDLKNLNDFLVVVEPDYLLNTMRSRGFHSYESFISQRRLGNAGNQYVDLIVGNILGMISFLRREYLNNK